AAPSASGWPEPSVRPHLSAAFRAISALREHLRQLGRKGGKASRRDLLGSPAAATRCHSSFWPPRRGLAARGLNLSPVIVFAPAAAPPACHRGAVVSKRPPGPAPMLGCPA